MSQLPQSSTHLGISYSAMLTVLEITNNTVDQRSKMQCNGANNVEISRPTYSQGIGMSTNLSLTDAKNKIIIENLEKKANSCLEILDIGQNQLWNVSRR